jgi:hypothetical protein
MDFDHRRSLAFLFSLAAVPVVGCASTSEGTGSGSDSSSGDTTSSDPTTEPTSLTLTTDDTLTTTADTTGEPTTATTTDSTTEGTTGDPSGTETTEGTTEDPSGTTAVDETTTTEASETTETTDDSTTTTTGGDGTVCENAAANLVECQPQYANFEDYIVAYCNSSIADYAAISEECGVAGEEFFACIGQAPCEELASKQPCPDEAAAIDAACVMKDGNP